MILKNKTNKYLMVEGKRVRPYRTVEVSNNVNFDKEKFEIEGEINKIIKVKKYGSK